MDSVLVKSISRRGGLPDQCIGDDRQGKKLVETPEYDLHIGEEDPQARTA